MRRSWLQRQLQLESRLQPVKADVISHFNTQTLHVCSSQWVEFGLVH